MAKVVKKDKLTEGQPGKGNDTNSPAGASSVKRLYRSEKNKVIAGVAGGIAEYLNIDPILVRFFFLVLISGAGSGFFIYFLLWLILPTESSVKTSLNEVVEENVADLKDQTQKIVGDIPSTNQNGKYVLGALIILVGIQAMLSAMNIHINFSWLWPILIVLLGVLIILKK